MNRGQVGNYFTHYWALSENEEFEGESLQHIVSNQFRTRGVEVGDTIFCVSRIDGQFCLVGRLPVDEITDAETAGQQTDQSADFDDRSDHILCRPGRGTPISFSRLVPLDIAMSLRFEGQPLKLDPRDHEKINTQTLRGVRKLDPASADVLNRIIDAELTPDADADADAGVDVEAAEEDGSEEGRRVLRMHFALERDRGIVASKKQQVLTQTGRLACECCGFDFAATYGDIGHGFAECHHRVWLSETPGDGFRITRTADLAITCANCHRMLHRERSLTVDGLRAIVSGHR